MARAIGVIITAKQPNAQILNPAKPQFPESKIGETVAKHPAIKNTGGKLMLTEEAVN